MTYINKVYVYTGSESGYTNGNWYYWNGSSWTSGGIYNAVAINIDSTPTQGSNNAVSSGGVWEVNHKTVSDVTVFANIDILDAWIDGYYYSGASSITNIKPDDEKKASDNFSCMVVECFADDVFYLTGQGGSGAKLWLWTKSNGDVISRATSNTVGDNLELTPPNDAAYLYVACSNTKVHELKKGKTTNDRINNVLSDFAGAEKVESWVRYKYIATNGQTVDVSNPTDGYANSYVILQCAEGDIFIITGKGGSGARLWCFADSSYNVISRADSSYSAICESVVAPENSAYLIVNVNHYRYYALYKRGANSFETTLNKRVSNIENVVSTLPKYFENEAQDTASKIVNACNEGSYVIGFITDSHYGISDSSFKTNWNDTIATVKRVNELRPFNMLIHGGDMVDGNVSASATTIILNRMKSDMMGATSHLHLLTGNHDDNLTYFKAQGSGFLTRQERFGIYAYGEDSDEVLNPFSAWYKDIPNLSLRIIGLDYILDDVVYTEQGHAYWGFTTEQIEWVRDYALNTPNQVVFFSHGPCTTEYGYGRDGVPTLVRNGDALRNVIESFVANDGIVVGFFHGHTHWDYIGQYSQTNGFKEIATGRAVFDMWTSANITYKPDGAVFEEKTWNTVTQELWDAIIILPKSRKVKIIRFGAGSDREFSY